MEEKNGREDEGRIGAELMHNADIIFQVSPLSTGYSKEVHGSILVTYRNVRNAILDHQKNLDFDHLFHYKIFDNSIKVFTPKKKVLN